MHSFVVFGVQISRYLAKYEAGMHAQERSVNRFIFIIIIFLSIAEKKE